MRHLTAGHNIAFGILDDLGRRQRRRFGGDCDCVHDGTVQRVLIDYVDMTCKREQSGRMSKSAANSRLPFGDERGDTLGNRTCMKLMMKLKECATSRAPPHSTELTNPE
jgi:hypothetical protein